MAPLELARAVPRLGQRAQELAQQHMAKGRQAIIGEGKLLNGDFDECSDLELQGKLAGDVREVPAEDVEPRRRAFFFSGVAEGIEAC